MAATTMCSCDVGNSPGPRLTGYDRGVITLVSGTAAQERGPLSALRRALAPGLWFGLGAVGLGLDLFVYRFV